MNARMLPRTARKAQQLLDSALRCSQCTTAVAMDAAAAASFGQDRILPDGVLRQYPLPDTAQPNPFEGDAPRLALARQSGVPESAPQVDPISRRQLEELVEFVQVRDIVSDSAWNSQHLLLKHWCRGARGS